MEELILTDVFDARKRLHNAAPRGTRKKQLELKDDTIVGTVPELHGKLTRVAEVCQDKRLVLPPGNETKDLEERYKLYVFSLSYAAYRALLNKIKFPLEEKEKISRMTPGPGVATTTQPVVSCRLNGGRCDPLREYGLRYLTDNLVTGGGYRWLEDPKWACCLLPRQDPGCLIGFKNWERVMPYKWFGGLQTFDAANYDQIVRNGRGVVYLERNLSRCNSIHEEIVDILLTPEIKLALNDEPAKRLNTPEVLVQLLRVAQLMHEYNEFLEPNPTVFHLTVDDMMHYLKHHLPLQIWQLYIDQLKRNYISLYNEKLELTKGAKAKTEAFVKKAEELVKRLTAMKEKLEEAEADSEFTNLPPLFDDGSAVSVLGKI